ncbi:hypothetical protein OAA60_00870 [Porticoccaceae bacterium]|nr:hypothetical protein [Porticoccaceae bacterium]
MTLEKRFAIKAGDENDPVTYSVDVDQDCIRAPIVTISQPAHDSMIVVEPELLRILLREYDNTVKIEHSMGR